MAVLSTQTQCAAAGHQQRHARTGTEQVGEHSRRSQQVFEVIQHEQHVARAQVVEYELPGTPTAQLAHPEHPCDGRWYQALIVQWCQIGEGNPVGVLITHSRRDGDGQPRLSHATGTNQRDQSHRRRAQERGDFVDVGFASDQLGQRHGQGWHRAGRGVSLRRQGLGAIARVGVERVRQGAHGVRVGATAHALFDRTNYRRADAPPFRRAPPD